MPLGILGGVESFGLLGLFGQAPVTVEKLTSTTCPLHGNAIEHAAAYKDAIEMFLIAGVVPLSSWDYSSEQKVRLSSPFQEFFAAPLDEPVVDIAAEIAELEEFTRSKTASKPGKNKKNVAWCVGYKPVEAAASAN